MTKDTCILSMDIGGTFLKCALVTKQKDLVLGSFIEMPVDSSGSQSECKVDFQKAMSVMKDKATSHNLSIISVGVSIPGPFNYELGMSLMTHKYPAIKNVELRPWFHEILGDISVVFMSDSAAYLMGQMGRGELEVYSRILLIMLGTGIGCASSIDGTILSKTDGSPLITVYKNAYKDGIAENYVGKNGIIRNYCEKNDLYVSSLDVIDIAKLAVDGDQEAVEVFDEQGLMLAETLAPIIEKYEFEVLIIGGQIARSYELFKRSLEENLMQSTGIKLITSAKEFNTGALVGAAQLLGV